MKLNREHWRVKKLVDDVYREDGLKNEIWALWWCRTYRRGVTWAMTVNLPLRVSHSCTKRQCQAGTGCLCMSVCCRYWIWRKKTTNALCGSGTNSRLWHKRHHWNRCISKKILSKCLQDRVVIICQGCDAFWTKYEENRMFKWGNKLNGAILASNDHRF